MGFFADPHFRCLRKPEISAFEVECLPGRADGLEKSAVDPGLRGAVWVTQSAWMDVVR
jgi:hypothetical protein